FRKNDNARIAQPAAWQKETAALLPKHDGRHCFASCVREARRIESSAFVPLQFQPKKTTVTTPMTGVA
ncbi:MAG: hypothetical protein ACREAC_29555, partial [Blastocatellia bacterium]